MWDSDVAARLPAVGEAQTFVGQAGGAVEAVENAPSGKPAVVVAVVLREPVPVVRQPQVGGDRCSLREPDGWARPVPCRWGLVRDDDGGGGGGRGCCIQVSEVQEVSQP